MAAPRHSTQLHVKVALMSTCELLAPSGMPSRSSKHLRADCRPAQVGAEAVLPWHCTQLHAESLSAISTCVLLLPSAGGRGGGGALRARAADAAPGRRAGRRARQRGPAGAGHRQSARAPCKHMLCSEHVRNARSTSSM